MAAATFCAFGGATPGYGTDAYVQKGLLAIWDGIENTGSTRQHDADATTWKDVVGDRAFELTGVTIAEDGLVFDGSGASSRGVLAAADAAATFGRAGNGMMEIVLFPDASTGQRVAVQGPNVGGAGLSIGIDGANRIYLQNLLYSEGPAYNWRGEANTFSVAYANHRAYPDKTGVYRNGVPMPSNLFGGSDFWGTPDAMAYVGGRARGDNGFSGKICCVRLYKHRLSAAEIAANAEVDRIRFLSKPGNGQMVVVGDPANIGSPTPAYGTQAVAAGEEVAFSAGQTELEDGSKRMRCVGHRILRVNVDGGWVQEGEDSAETTFSYVPDGAAARKVEWIWEVADVLGAGAPEIVSARRRSAEFGIRVAGAGYDGFGARLSLVWGTSAQRLDQTNAVATVFGPCDCRAHLTRTKAVDYFVRTVLEKLDADGNAVDVVASESVRLPSDRCDDERDLEYVRDGLVAWWDGICNDGSSGAFVAAPATWKDVVGDVGFSVNGYAPSATRDSMVFPGVKSAYGVLTAQDTANTFGACADGTFEIVARGNQQNAANVALRASDASGIAFGPAYHNNAMRFIFHASNGNSVPTMPGDWETRRTFAARYANAVPQNVWVDGAPNVMLSDVKDFWGRGGGDGVQALIGCRADGAYPLNGEICAIRLYSRRLTDDEIVANSRVDDVRFRGRLTRDCLEIAGAPHEYGLTSPVYGDYPELADGARVVCTAPASVREGDMLATCAGWQLFTNAVDDALVWLPCRAGDGTECAYEHENGVAARLVWQWELSGGGALDAGALAFEDVTADSLRAVAPVLGLGGAASGTMTLRWGCSPDALTHEASQTVTGVGDVAFALEGLLPGRRYFVQATLSAEGIGEVATDVAACDTLADAEPADVRERFLANGLAYVSAVVADGRPGDGVIVTGKVEFPSGAGDCVWRVLVWNDGASDTACFAVDDVSVDGDGNFSFAVVTDDPDADDYIRPGRRCELAVVADLGGGAVSASASSAFATAAAARFDLASVSAQTDFRQLQVSGRMLEVGAGDAVVLTLMAGEAADALVDVAETSADAEDASFSLTCVLPEVERVYWWSVRCVNETTGKTVVWTNALTASSVKTEDSSHYVWTGAAGSGLWRDRGNWSVRRSSSDSTPVAAEDCVGFPNSPKASAAFPAGSSAVEVDGDVSFWRLSMNAAGANVTLTSAGGKTVTVVHELVLSDGGTKSDPTVKVFDGVKIVATGSSPKVGNGGRTILRNGAELACSEFLMQFDGGRFGGGEGTHRMDVGAGCKMKTNGKFFLASGAECIVSNGTLEVGGNLVFNCETDGGTLRLEGDRPSVVVKGDCRSTIEPLQLTASGGFVFDVPMCGYRSAPVVLSSGTVVFGGTDAQACQPLHVNVVKKSGAYRNPKTTVYPLLSTAGAINLSRQTFGGLKRPAKSAFVYSDAVDEPVWLTRDELSPSAAPKLLGVRLGGTGGMMLRVR